MPRLTYRDAGVDIDAGNELVRRIAPAVRRTRRPELLSHLGGFAALASAAARLPGPCTCHRPPTASVPSSDSPSITTATTMWDRILLRCASNDVLVAGAEPFLFLDYYASGALDVDVAERVINGIAKACEVAGCALAGGETAEMPGFYPRGRLRPSRILRRARGTRCHHHRRRHR